MADTDGGGRDGVARQPAADLEEPAASPLPDTRLMLDQIALLRDALWAYEILFLAMLLRIGDSIPNGRASFVGPVFEDAAQCARNVAVMFEGRADASMANALDVFAMLAKHVQSLPDADTGPPTMH